MENSFLQSKNWENFQQSLGRTTFWVAGKLVTKIPMILGQSYLYSARPYFEKEEDLEDFLGQIDELAQHEKTFFFRFEPIFGEKFDLSKSDLKKVASRQPETTLMVDLNASKDDVLQSMKPKTRYNIKLAEKKGVRVRISRDPKDVEIFYNIAQETAKRDKIKFFPEVYYKNLADNFSKDGLFKIYIASYNGTDIAANIMLYYKDTATYLHGASSNQDRNVMAPYFLQWKAIEDAKNNGFRWYDFWGISPLAINDTRYELRDGGHPWAGISKFKLGFAPGEKIGKYVEYPGCFEVSYGKKRYFLYSMFKSIR